MAKYKNPKEGLKIATKARYDGVAYQSYCNLKHLSEAENQFIMGDNNVKILYDLIEPYVSEQIEQNEYDSKSVIEELDKRAIKTMYKSVAAKKIEDKDDPILKYIEYKKIYERYKDRFEYTTLIKVISDDIYSRIKYEMSKEER